MVRTVGSNIDLPTGGSPGFDFGSLSAFAREDHAHVLWDAWTDLTLVAGWTGTLRYCKSGDLVMVYGSVTNPSPGAPASTTITTLPVEVRPKNDLLFKVLSDIGGVKSPDAIRITSAGVVSRVSIVLAGPNPTGFGTNLRITEVLFKND